MLGRASVGRELSPGQAQGGGPALTFTLGLEPSGVHLRGWLSGGNRLSARGGGLSAGMWTWPPSSRQVPQQPGTGGRAGSS